MNIVLVSPEIPQNTGNIGRLCAATYTTLHLVKPFSFSLDDRYLKRAGLDYWPLLTLKVHEDWEDFLKSSQCSAEQLWMFTKFAERDFTTITYQPNDYLVFGCETKGLPEELHTRYAAQRVRIPIDNPGVRSLNLANAAAVALYEARRKRNTD